jgi:non-ribosomal peptide synthetase component E (peptide arylation enzyme)
MTMNVSHIIRPHVWEKPNKTAIIFGDHEFSYAGLDDLVTRVAKGVTGMGSGKALTRMLRDGKGC